MTSLLRRPATPFLLATLTLFAACVLIARSAAFARNPDVAAWGITFDLTITLPLLHWFFLVRRGHARPLTMIPVFIAGTIAATLLLPRGQQQFLADLRLFVLPCAELLLLGVLVQRVRKLQRSTSTDPYARIRHAARSLVGENRAADVVASEIAMLYYAIFCWRKRPDAIEGQMTFHQRSGWGTIVVCLMVLLVVESFGMHLLLRLWTPLAAWIWTAMDVWAAAWLLGDYHALRLRRSFFDGETLHVRFGLRWNVAVSIDDIASIEETPAEKSAGVLRVAILEEPRWRITLREPVVAEGLAGIRKTIGAIALLPDDDEAITSLRLALARCDARATLR